MCYLFIYFSLCKFAKFLMSFFQATSLLSFKFCINLQCHQAELPCTFFSSNITYFGQRSQLKNKLFRFLSVRVKICQVPHVNFQMTNQFLFKFCIILHCRRVMRYNSSVNVKLILFLLWTKGSHQSPNFGTFKCSGENLPNFSCHFSNQKSVFLQILYHSSVSRKITPLYFFRSNIIYFGYKEPIKMQFF